MFTSKVINENLILNSCQLYINQSDLSPLPLVPPPGHSLCLVLVSRQNHSLMSTIYDVLFIGCFQLHCLTVYIVVMQMCPPEHFRDRLQTFVHLLHQWTIGIVVAFVVSVPSFQSLHISRSKPGMRPFEACNPVLPDSCSSHMFVGYRQGGSYHKHLSLSYTDRKQRLICFPHCRFSCIIMIWGFPFGNCVTQTLVLQYLFLSKRQTSLTWSHCLNRVTQFA